MSAGLTIQTVEPDSIGAATGLVPGDRIVAINDAPVEDIIDYRFHLTDEYLRIDVIRQSGDALLLEVTKEYDDDLGLAFTAPFPALRRCGNRCLFCFVDQMPPGLRTTLYVKDDDYRLSFWEGNFVTLTNVGHRELQRIAAQRLSPLYVSVHTTNPELRRRMMGHPRAGELMNQLAFLKTAGIEMHTQVVLCPGINDNEELRRTVRDLATLWPLVRSLAVVPVGRTRFREGLYPLRDITPAQARDLVEEVAGWQNLYRKDLGSSFVYAADEFYLRAGLPVPPAQVYEDFSQLENGVGMVRLFLDEWHRVEKKIPESVRQRRVTLVTGHSGASLLTPVAERLNRVQGLTVNLVVVDNDFLGRTVTVSGLLTGSDIGQALLDRALGDLVVIPETALRDGCLFLDGTTLPELEKTLGVPVVTASGPRELVRQVLGSPQRSYDGRK